MLPICGIYAALTLWGNCGRMMGKIKFFNAQRGFGFITTEAGEDVYFSAASLPLGRKYDPVEGDAVAFDLRDARKGKMAHHVELETAS